MAHRIAGILQVGDWIVFVALALGQAPNEVATRATPVPNYVVADVFSPDFSIHRRTAYREDHPWGASLWHNGAGQCDIDGDTVRLDTGRWVTPWQTPADVEALRTMPMWGRVFTIPRDGIAITAKPWSGASLGACQPAAGATAKFGRQECQGCGDRKHL